MVKVSIGYTWLQATLALPNFPLPISSRLGGRLETHTTNGCLIQIYPASYRLSEDPLDHLEFALKHEGVNLPILSAACSAIEAAAFMRRVQHQPTSKYARLLCFYYEFCTEQALPLPEEIVIGGNYVDALPSDGYIVSSSPRRNRRWRINDNLPGNSQYCPSIRRLPGFPRNDNQTLQSAMQRLIAEYPAELFQRAADYLYLKETKSTYRIENEDLPPKERTQKFLRLLMTAGDESALETLKEEKLAQRQNAIVDARYAEPSFRAIQNYVGENRPWGQKVHYLCPPPSRVASLMEGLRLSTVHLENEHPVIQAAAVAFGFVFIHPFEDGNGRLHRFLIHDTLHRRRMLPAGVTLPVSATMLRHRAIYDGALEAYSAPLVEPDGLARWQEDADGAVTLLNPDIIDDYYRFPDLTAQTTYLLETLELTVQEDFADELRFLQKFDAARESIREVVDLPDRRLDLLLKLLHQNTGKLAARKREEFSELSHAELESIEQCYQEAFSRP